MKGAAATRVRTKSRVIATYAPDSAVWPTARLRIDPASLRASRSRTRSSKVVRFGLAATAHRTSASDSGPPRHMAASREGVTAKPRRRSRATVRRTRFAVEVAGAPREPTATGWDTSTGYPKYLWIWRIIEAGAATYTRSRSSGGSLMTADGHF